MGMTVLGNQASSGAEPDASTGQLVKQLSEEISQLVRDEMKLATVEMTGKAKNAGDPKGGENAKGQPRDGHLKI